MAFGLVPRTKRGEELIKRRSAYGESVVESVDPPVLHIEDTFLDILAYKEDKMGMFKSDFKIVQL